MSTFCKEEGETSGLDMKPPKIKTENHGHTFRFRYGYKKYSVTCNAPMTVLKSLETNFFFKAICKKNQDGRNKEIVIRRELYGKGYRAAVTPHFPCCLLNKDELLDITFIKSGGKSTTVTTPNLHIHSAEDLVCIYIKTRGDENIHNVMKNSKLKVNLDEVCVYGVKEEKVKAALKRDGRFNSVIFKKGALRDLENDCIVNLSNLIEYLDGKQFQIIIKPHQTDSQESSQEMSETSEPVKDEKNEIPETLQATNTTHDSTNTQEKKTETTPKAKESRRYPETKEIPNSHEILTLLREQYADLLKTLKERESLKNNVHVKRFFRQEYDKSDQSFSEVKRVKKLMRLSDSVCQIRSDDFARGTGFLLFNKFILTSAHVVGDYDPFTRRMEGKLTAAFGFEDLSPNVEQIEVEEKIVALFHGKNKKGSHLDFALLELSSDKKHDAPELLTYYSAPPTRGSICIIGHPDGKVKLIDPCIIIPKPDREQAAAEYYKKNETPQVLQIITRWCLAEDAEIRNSQILYNTCFFHGSSGSPVFDERCRLIGIHTGGYVYEGQGKKTRSVMEYALPMLPILAQICMQCRSERPDVVQHFEKQNNMEYVFQYANEHEQQS